MLVAAVSGAGVGGATGGSAGGDKKAEGTASASASASPSPTVQAAAYRKLPEPCAVLTKKTLGDLVPEGTKSGKEGTSSDTGTRGSCSWDSLDNNGVKGSQFRWLNVSMLRFESDATRGAGDALAGDYYTKQLQDAQSADGAKGVKTEPFTGAGDEASVVTYELKKKEGTFKQQTVVVRAENVVVTVDYNGAGLAGDRTPDTSDLVKDAEKAAKEVVAAVAEANGDTAASPSESSSKPSSDSSKPSSDSSKPSSDSSSKSPSASASASPSESATQS
jgi:DNA-binding protein YbaB